MIMLKILIFVILGYLLGYLINEKALKINQKLMTYWLLALLFVMGVSITIDRTILNNINRLGLTALIIASLSVLGSVIFLAIISPLFKNIVSYNENENKEEQSNNKFLFFILLALVLGAIGGFLLPQNVSIFLENFVVYLLYLLLFSVGYDLYCNRHLLKLIKVMGIKIILIPLSIIFGSLIFSLPLFLLMDYNLGEIGAVVSGFGWYSLSSIIIGTTYSQTLGVLALLTNVFRELLAFVLTPMVPKFLPKITGIGPAGATAMDTLLPLITKSSGAEYTLPALVSGIVISSSVYLLVPLFIELAKLL